MDFLVHGQLSCFPEGARAAWIVAFKGFLLCVDVHVFLQILPECEGFKAQHADMFLDHLM